MPFDALVMQAVARAWNRDLRGSTFHTARYEGGTVRFGGRDAAGRPMAVLVALAPGFQRLHRIAPLPGGHHTRHPFFQDLVPFTLEGVEVVPWERVMYWVLSRPDEWDLPVQERLAVELAGHLTNLIRLDAGGTLVKDALRRVAPGRPGRTVWPGQPYTPPPRLPDPSLTRNPAHLPPWGRLWLEEGHSLEELLEVAAQGRFDPQVFPPYAGEKADVWVLPLRRRPHRPAADLEQALDQVYAERERQARLEAQARTAYSRLEDRRRHLAQRLGEYREWAETDPAREKELGDLWLAWQGRFAGRVPPVTEEVEDLYHPGTRVLLSLPEGSNPVEEAERHYRRFKKLNARRQAAARLLPAVAGELEVVQRLEEELEARRQRGLEAGDGPWLRQLARRGGAGPARPGASEALPYRRFLSVHGLEIWVGRNAEENQRLTFREARPDDLWLHVKQASGSHVLLRCGRTNPDPEDVLDAAHLAAFYSPARHSGMVPVDYTRRKYVRKRPHGTPGQVLYQQERTLFVTPDPERLERLGAMRGSLADSGNEG
ncbi:Fibronectin/fibrinogen-binding protein [Candidatus Hydrogenisulfobacillus filiaventi]|uniref:Fibronectin/fibrinogen-binding protein n=1 Tax=Candidatus Hydrogenisulfobacillus filiaventi TaxID=2707344 RepID=A0A6F8ZFE1_9FIRM|nr:NFACT RNA binding domain-containing protein [Bacillota bacterium]CAB1128497.1 Fibronectin/fibrinogen-binding protein [Candidatus Hydrogenisulfobacillus filiaventi]